MKTSYTDYEEIYSMFLGSITDQPFLSLPEEEILEYCLLYLKRVIPKFTKCRVDLSNRNDTLGYFYFSLTDLEISILGSLMVVEWLSPQVFNITVTKQFLGDSEYKHFSQANHLGTLMKLKDYAEDESYRLIILYTNDLMSTLND